MIVCNIIDPNILTYNTLDHRIVSNNAIESYIILGIILLINLIFKGFGSYRNLDKEIDELKTNAITISPEELFRLRKYYSGRNTPNTSRYNFTGVYILHNTTRDMYYVGQAKRILDRVNTHFTGRGNGDVYADYKYGDTFEISMIALNNSGFTTLNELERNTIRRYNAYYRGYNRTRGNRG